MRIAICSDLHLEFGHIDLSNTNNAEVLILSGDVLLGDYLKDFPDGYDNSAIVSSRQMKAWRFREFLKDCATEFPHVVYVAGNHEFYHGNLYQVIKVIQQECDNIPNLHFLEDRTVSINGVKFVGATLWTDCNNADSITLFDLSKFMADFKIIRNDRAGYRKWTPEDSVLKHRDSLRFIKSVVANAGTDTPVVVVTHHAPSFQSVSEIYKDDHYINGGYMTELSEFILDNQNIALWTHGHMHNKSDYLIGSTRVICNPRGYIGHEEIANSFELVYVDISIDK